MIKICCCTRRESPEETDLYKSLQKVMCKSELSWEFITSNSNGLSYNYNNFINKNIDKANDDDIFMFIHDDVIIEDIYFEDKLLKGHFDYRYDILGVAGCEAFEVEHPVIWNKKNLVGYVIHEQCGVRWATNFGKTPRQSLIVDGVLISCTAKILKNPIARFDEQFNFHFYDLDFCLTGTQKCSAIIGVVPINIVHKSIGDWTKNAEWQENEPKFIQKWR